MKILVINGPNLNNLGKRDKAYYGDLTLAKIYSLLKVEAKKLNCELEFFQSNHEGALIDFLQKESKNANGILINPGALTHYGYSLYDGLVDANLPIIEVHLSDIKIRKEVWRRKSVIKPIAIKQIAGKKEKSYLEGLIFLVKYIRSLNIKNFK
ncbi:MAG: type II 3-dehydroquinate dehydratase [bacterium]